ncbi:hypothetical protein KVV02_005724 [Mortierella alpina]|uniref:Uncharacterized protein n=1 Tax=Mortierella alpina TaxID=64518 RepID=A0A9P8AAD0_MORAP|nr:hypothetical protein KVV02_005724 [Mortierella alpina]
MHLDGPTQDALKAYLTKELALISDADPAMLADYIIALLKHDKETHELKSLCNLQLDDFLMKETEPFVTKLFDALESKSYLQSQGGADSPLKPYNDDEEDLIPTGPAAERNPSRVQQSDIEDSRGHREKHRRGDSDVSEDEDRSYKHVRRGTDRDNSTEHRRREYSPSRPSDEDRFGGRRRRSNDYSSTNDHADTDRRGDRSGAPARQQGITTLGFNSRNNMNSSQGFNNNMNNGMDRGQWNGPPHQRNNFQDQHNNGSWRGAANMRGGRGGIHGGPGFGQERRRQRCRDYDEKGFCLRGDDCPYDHGEDRIVVDDMQRVPFDMMGGLPGMGHNGMAMGSNRPPFFPGGPNGGMMPNPSEVYDPETGAPRDDMGARTGNEPFDARRQQGGFESGRFQDGSGRGGMRGRGSLRGMRGGRGRGGSAHPYATPGRFGAGGGAGGSKTSLVVEHIPDEFNTIDKVNDFFKQFGALTNIQVDQPAHKALIQYSTREEASAAYNSPEVIFGNRFVKVYWQPDDVDAATFGRQPKPTGQVRPEMGAGSGPGGAHRPPHSHSHAHSHAAPLTPATSVLMTPERAAELAAERAAAAAKMEENKKTMQEIQLKKDELIKRQQEEQKKIMEKLFANKTMSQEDKDEILKGLKNVAIEVTKEMADPMAQARAAATAAEAHRQAELRKEAERLEKAKLDLELEGLNSTDPDKAAAGVSAPASTGSSDAAETTAALKAKLAALQAQANALGLEHQGGYAGRGRGGFMPRGRGRGAPTNTWTRGGGRGGAIVSQHRTFRIDNRTSKLSVNNVDEASKDRLKEHFEAFGELESFSLGPDGTSATVHYKNRKDAESAMQQGSQLANAPAPLKLGWISEPQAPAVPGLVSPPTTAFTKSFTPSPHAATATTAAATPAAPSSAATAYHHESEDDDEDGERSWKR